MRALDVEEVRRRASRRSRASVRVRVDRLRAKAWQVVQCAVAAGVAWTLASEVLGHSNPVFAPIAAVVSLGTSYAQRLRRVVEVTVGVAVGVLLADLLVAVIGAGGWQMTVVVLLAMPLAILITSGTMLVNQAAIQSIFVVALLPGSGASLTRWTDALVGGGVALVAATVVPSAPLRRPKQQAGKLLAKLAELLHGVADAAHDEDVDAALDLLAEARATDPLVRQLQDAADEGMAVVASSPFRVRHRPGIQRMSTLVEPLDRAIRSTRVLVRQVAMAGYHRRPLPESYLQLLHDLGDAADLTAAELAREGTAFASRATLLAVGAATGEVERSSYLAAEVVLAQVRSVVVDLLLLTGMDQLEATDSLPPPPR